MPQTPSIEYFRLFFETAQSLLSSPALQPTLDALVERTASALGVKAASLRLIDAQTGRLELVAAHGLSRTYLEKGALSADRSIPEVLNGKAVSIKDAGNDPRIQYRDAMRAEGINTVLSVPVIAGEKVIGVLRLYSAVRRDFSVGEIEFVAALAEMGGLAISNARLYEAEGGKLAALLREIGVELPAPFEMTAGQLQGFAPQPLDPEKSLEYFRTLHEVTRAILSTRDSHQVMQLIVERVIAILQVKACALRLINETTHELELLAARGLSERFLSKGPPHTDRSIRATLAGTPVLIADTATDPRLEYPAETVAEGIASILSLPIVAHRHVVGVLRIYAAQQRPFSQEEVTFLAALAEIAGIAIMNTRLHEKTQYDLSFWTATLGYLQEETK
jgi:GAF domain-containing protein